MCGICGNYNGDPADDVRHDQDRWLQSPDSENPYVDTKTATVGTNLLCSIALGISLRPMSFFWRKKRQSSLSFT